MLANISSPFLTSAWVRARLSPQPFAWHWSVHFINVHGFMPRALSSSRCSSERTHGTHRTDSPPARSAAGGLEHVLALCDFSSAPEPNGFMVTTHCSKFGLIHRHFRPSPFGCPDRHRRHVSGRGEPAFLVTRESFFGGRQFGPLFDSLPHFLTCLSFLAFLVVHVTLIVMTGLCGET